MKKIEICGHKGCEKWKSSRGDWTENLFLSKQDERLSWKITKCPDHQHKEEKMTETRKPIVMCCLHMDGDERCTMTAWHGTDDWQQDEERDKGMNSGRYTSMMAQGGNCSFHKKDRKAS